MEEQVHSKGSSCGIVVDKVALGQVYLRVFGLSIVSIIPSMLHTHSLIYHRCFIILAVDNAVNTLGGILSYITL
jgi:hypothetical protein